MAKVYLALGSNLGNRFENINQAVGLLKSRVGTLCSTSLLYTTKPQYVEDQPPFLNAAVAFHTSLSPTELLVQLKTIETEVGRVPSIRFGPRAIDVDILFYDNDNSTLRIESVNDLGDLVIPHPRISERTFVLRPLMDLVPDFTHPDFSGTITEMYNALVAVDDVTNSNDALLYAIFPIKETKSDCYWKLRGNTRVMGIINATPDSFSSVSTDLPSIENVLESVGKMVNAGVDIIDVGGESTRPGATPVTLSDEIERVVPVISAIRKAFPNIPISIDTTKASVAEAAIKAGANVINDVSAGRKDYPEMYKVVEQTGVPYIMMHSRGTPCTMTSLKNYNDVTQVVAKELLESVSDALSFGIPRWGIMLDPGIGFAKGKSENLKILKSLPEFISKIQNYPILIGASRKKFIRELVGDGSVLMGTAATTCAAVSGGALCVRVHDVPETIDLCKVSNAIFNEVLF